MTAATATLLVELLTEELPPKTLRELEKSFADAIDAGLLLQGFIGEPAKYKSFSTPRRLALTIPNVAAKSPDKPFKQKLMPVSVAYDAAGKPTQALVKKLAALGLPGDVKLLRETDGKAEALFHEGTKPGIGLAEGLQLALNTAIATRLPKVMSYARAGGYYNEHKFVRPAHRLVALHGVDVVAVRALGLDAGRVTAGHRFLSRSDIEIKTADAYAPTLEAEGKVWPDFAARRERIVAGLEAAAAGAKIIMPDALLDEVTALVEWPKVYTGGFDATFLEVPQECLILTMQQSQKYFALEGKDGRLQNRFLLVSNLDVRDPESIVHGNERVLRARLADAKFFYDHDRQQRLDVRVERLRSVVYQTKLGTQAERMDRLRFLATKIAPLVGADVAAADRAALLAKADLVTNMVGEFPELQGTMGRYYALDDGESRDVADAIAQHYWPRFAGDALPKGAVAQAVALADKLEALAGLFGVGQIPTGDKDPFGLRRAALGVVRILVERKLRISLSSLAGLAYKALNAVPGIAQQPEALLDFIHERLRGYLREQGFTANQVASVIDTRPDIIDDILARLAAVCEFEKLPEAGALAAANKRIVNILRKSGSDTAVAVDRSLFADGAEHDLFAAVQKLLPAVDAHVKRGAYTDALRALASARQSVDRFFDEVLVMAEDPAVRANRLALLRGLAEAMNQVADISKLAV